MEQILLCDICVKSHSLRVQQLFLIYVMNLYTARI